MIDLHKRRLIADVFDGLNRIVYLRDFSMGMCQVSLKKDKNMKKNKG